MENDNMTQTELIVFLETLAENIELKAKNPRRGRRDYPRENQSPKIKR